jgi:hypothetical protein
MYEQKILSHTKPDSEYSNSAERNVQREGDTDGNNDHRRNLCAIWTKHKDIQCKRTTKVKKAEDVDQIMSLLQNKAVEHALAIHIDQKWYI